MTDQNPLDAARQAARKVVAAAAQKVEEKVGELLEPPIPGAPAAAPPSLEEPPEPGTFPHPKPDQSGPEPHTATGAPDGAQSDHAQQGDFLTTASGLRIRDTDHSLKAGERGPPLLQAHHLREKITHFDHERIPERVVHARGTGAHGVFIGYGNAKPISMAGFPAKKGQ